MIDPHKFTSPYQLTKSMHRDVYPAVDARRPELSAKGKVVIVTGAGGGLGYRVVEAWATAGAAGIVLVGRTESTLKHTAATMAGSIPTLVVPTNITSVDAVESMYEKVKERFDHAHVLVDTAGVLCFGSTLAKSEPDEWWGAFETNVRGTYLLSRGFIRAFEGVGTIMNFVSIAAWENAPGMSAYTVAKSAIMRLTEMLHSEQPDLRVFSLHPGISARDEDRGMFVPAFEPFCKDKQQLTAGVTLWLSTSRADFLKGGFVSVNWDVSELEAHKDEIQQKRLNKLAMLNARLGVDGQPWAG
ncbi:NAD(P)-binding protein [Myriangium duriaei CBS 260.36]|uniref:NAD(P)-binding protein n=1 Tax=Myriangium duriaei CBS 260.36 TaxID=1168546 RepID=A0A9P4ISJ0_9PEZI|nr:NAD(P)-binding protein [Myriangium duriaei CBS 260.36]